MSKPPRKIRLYAQIAMDIGLAVAIAVTMAALMASGAPALAEANQPMAEAGHRLAALHCSRCHEIEAEGDSAVAAAPPLRQLYERYPNPALTDAFEQGLLSSHPAMPAFRFSRDELRALLHYIRSIQEMQEA